WPGTGLGGEQPRECDTAEPAGDLLQRLAPGVEMAVHGFPPHSTYRNSFEHSSIWQKLCQAACRASSLPRFRRCASALDSAINAAPSATSSTEGGRPTARRWAVRIRSVSVLFSAISDLAKCSACSRTNGLLSRNSVCAGTVVSFLTAATSFGSAASNSVSTSG